MAAVSLARASLELVPASFSYELVCHVAACVWVSMFAIWKLVFVKFFVYLFSSRAAAVCGDAQHTSTTNAARTMRVAPSFMTGLNVPPPCARAFAI